MLKINQLDQTHDFHVTNYFFWVIQANVNESMDIHQQHWMAFYAFPAVNDCAVGKYVPATIEWQIEELWST